MIVAFDYDGTLKRSSQIDAHECAMWGTIMRALQAHGHKIVIATMRTGHTQDVREIGEYMGWVGLHDVPVVYCGERGLKREVCASEGYKVDVWIDDMPGMIEAVYAL